MIGKVVTGCVAILPNHTATQDRGSECRDFGFISRIVTALFNTLRINISFLCALNFFMRTPEHCTLGLSNWLKNYI